MGRETEEPLVVIDAASMNRPLFTREFWAYRSLLMQLSVGVFRAKYLHLRTSFLWYYVRPIVLTLVFVLLRVGVGNDLGEGAPYALFVFAGVCFWFIFADTLMAASSALARDANLIRKVYFPIIMSPMAQVLARLGDVALALLGIGVLQAIFRVGFDTELFMLAPVVAVMLVTALGLGCALAAVSLTTPDARESVSIMLLLGLFISPVFYAPAAMPEAARIVLNINPMVGLLGGVRGAMFVDTPFPWAAFIYSCAFAAVSLTIGAVLFSRASRNAAEQV